jgi:hypothetical protein
MLTDVVARYGGLHLYTWAPTYAFRIDFRDAQGRRNQHGHATETLCMSDQSLIAIDGGNGWMAQGSYAVPFRSRCCRNIYIDMPSTGSSVKRYGPFAPGSCLVRAS